MRNITLTGRVVSDAVVKTTPSGVEFVEFRFVNHEYSKKAEDNGSDTYWFNVVSFNQNTMNMVQHIIKGRSLDVIGKLNARPYVNKTSGQVEAGLAVVADSISFDNNFSMPKSEDTTTDTETVAAPTPKKTTTKKSAPTTGKVKIEKPTDVTTDDGDDDLPF